MKINKKDELYAKVKDSIQLEIDEKNRERLEKREEEDINETKGIMDIIGKQQAQLSDLVRQSRLGNRGLLILYSEWV